MARLYLKTPGLVIKCINYFTHVESVRNISSDTVEGPSGARVSQGAGHLLPGHQEGRRRSPPGDTAGSASRHPARTRPGRRAEGLTLVGASAPLQSPSGRHSVPTSRMRHLRVAITRPNHRRCKAAMNPDSLGRADKQMYLGVRKVLKTHLK